MGVSLLSSFWLCSFDMICMQMRLGRFRARGHFHIWLITVRGRYNLTCCCTEWRLSFVFVRLFEDIGRWMHRRNNQRLLVASTNEYGRQTGFACNNISVIEASLGKCYCGLRGSVCLRVLVEYHPATNGNLQASRVMLACSDILTDGIQNSIYRACWRQVVDG